MARFWFLCGWLGLSGVAMAASAGMPGFGAPVVERIDASRLGAAHPMSFAIHQADDGALYLANVDGLVRVSGSRADTLPLGSNGVVRALLPVGNALFVGGYDAFGELVEDPEGRFALIEHSGTLEAGPIGAVWDLIAWRDAVLVVTEDLLIRRVGAQNHLLQTPARTTAGFLYRDRVYLRADGIGLLLLSEDGSTLAPVPGTALLAEGAVRRVVPVGADVVLATAQHGLLRFDGTRLQAWPPEGPEVLRQEQPYALLRLDDGRLLVGTLAGALHLLSAEGRWLQSHRVVPAPILDIHPSREGGLLVATERGMYRVDWPGPWERAGTELGLEGSIHDLLRHRDATWVATSVGLFRRAEHAGASAKFERMSAEVSDLSEIVRVEDEIVLAGDQGLQVWHPDGPGPALDSAGHCYSVVASIRDPGRVYGVCDQGLLIARREGWKLRPLAEVGGALARISTLIEDPGQDQLWVTLLEGMPRRVDLSPQGGVRGEQELGTGLPAKVPILVMELGGPAAQRQPRVLASDRVWVWTGERWRAASDPFPPAFGAPVDFVLLEDALGNELLVTRRGLALRRRDQSVWHRVRLPGATSAQLTGGRVDRGLYLWDHERIWRASLGADGFAGVFSAPVGSRVRVDRVRVESLTERRELPRRLDPIPQLPLGTQLLIDFSLPTLALPVDFRSRLGSEEHPGEYGAWTTDTSRLLPPLPRGRFRLEIEARDALGILAEPAVLRFDVTSPWWHSRWLQLGAGIALAVLLTGVISWLRSNLLKHRNRQLEQLVRERTEALSEANRQLTLQANSDGLTGLLNRRRFDEEWQRAFSAAVHAGREVGLMLVDLDHFKNFNDRNGHLMGDERLRACAQWLEACAVAESGASAYRYGGEEFAIILESTHPAAAEAFAATLCRGAEQRFGADGTTLSVGLCCAVPGARDEPLAWLAAVDGALYAAKHAGRNCVRVHRP
jgi:diguanylate cyclase (GGDEF)-like protein